MSKMRYMIIEDNKNNKWFILINEVSRYNLQLTYIETRGTI